MEIAKLILDYIAVIAWPAVVITMFLLLRHPIKALIARIKQARVKKGDTEFTFEMMEKALGTPTEEKTGVIPLAEVTKENFNWETFTDMASGFQWTLGALLMRVAIDPTTMEQDTARMGMHTFEEICSLLKDKMSADDLARIRELRNRFAHSMDNPS